jgi:hypothetical protein
MIREQISLIIARHCYRIVCIALAAIIFGGSRVDAIAQSAPLVQPQLYLTNDTVPRKGYIEQGSKTGDDKVAFRICGTSERIIVPLVNLKETVGTCTLGCLWCVGRIVKFNLDGSVQIEALDRQTVDVSAEDWKKGFKWPPHDADDNQPLVPKVGDFVGGDVARNRPGSLYLIEKLALQPYVRG